MSILNAARDNLAKQVLTVAITECEADINADVLCKMVQNFELNIKLLEQATPDSARAYFGRLRDRLAHEEPSYLEFERNNNFFYTDHDLGFVAITTNKCLSGRFKYRMALPGAKPSDVEKKFSVIDLQAKLVAKFHDYSGPLHEYAPVGSQVLMISCPMQEDGTFTKVYATLTDPECLHPDVSETIALNQQLTDAHRFDLVYNSENVVFFVASSTQESGRWCAVMRVLIIKATVKGQTLKLEQIWLNVDSWECKVLALPSRNMPGSIYFYIFGWTGSQLEIFSVLVDPKL